MFLKITLGLSLGFISSTNAQEFFPDIHKVETFSTLANYLEYHTGGAVTSTRESDLHFRINPLWNEAVPLLQNANPDLIHSLFKTDVEEFLKDSDSEDFVSYKKKFYSSQSFNKHTQRYSRPYVYPSDWKSLNHNPIRKVELPRAVYGQQFKRIDDKLINTSPLLEVSFHRKLDTVTETEMTSGNKLRFLSNGQDSFAEKIRMVRQTKRFFHSVVMVQYCDKKGDEFVDAMIDQAQAGKDVRLIVENVWTKLIMKKCLAKLRRGGVKVTLGKGFFNPKTMFTVHHTKFWIRDGEEAVMGGQNMHDHENLSNGFNDFTRDKDVHVTGPAVTDMMREYIRIWNEQQKTPDESMSRYTGLVKSKEASERTQGLRGVENYDSWLGRDASEIPGVCRVLVQGTKATSSASIISKAYIEIMNNMKFSMFATSPTFRYGKITSKPYGNGRIVEAISKAADRGVKVDMISNGVDGGWGEAGYQLKGLARKLEQNGEKVLAKVVLKMAKLGASQSVKGNRKHLSKLMKSPSVDSWLYFNHTHAKQMMFDHILTSTGSFNLDTFSYRNHESTMICLDKKLADESMEGFILDIINSTPVL